MRLSNVALQSSVSRIGEVLLLAFGHEAEGVSGLKHSGEQALLDLTHEQGGRGLPRRHPTNRKARCTRIRYRR